MSIPGSLALNLSPGTSASPRTRASITKVRGSAIKALSVTSTEAADAGAYAGTLGLAANPLELGPATSPSIAATFGFSVAINDLKAGAQADLSGSTLTTTADAPITVRARSQDVALKTVSIAAAGSSSNATAGGGLGSYAVAGSGAGAENSYASPIAARISGSTINAPATGNGAALTIDASSDEQVLAVTGGGQG